MKQYREIILRVTFKNGGTADYLITSDKQYVDFMRVIDGKVEVIAK